MRDSTKLNHIERLKIFLSKLNERDLVTINIKLEQTTNQKEEDLEITKNVEKIVSQFKSFISIPSISVYRWNVSGKVPEKEIEKRKEKKTKICC